MAAMDRIRDELAKTKDPKINYLGEGVTAMLTLHPEYEGRIDVADKSLKGCLEAIKRGAKGGVSDPIMSAKAICDYYGITDVNARQLAIEVHMAMMGATPEPVTSVVPGASVVPVTKSQAPANVRTAEGGKGATAIDFDLDALLGGL